MPPEGGVTDGDVVPVWPVWVPAPDCDSRLLMMLPIMELTADCTLAGRDGPVLTDTLAESVPVCVPGTAEVRGDDCVADSPEIGMGIIPVPVAEPGTSEEPIDTAVPDTGPLSVPLGTLTDCVTGEVPVIDPGGKFDVRLPTIELNSLRTLDGRDMLNVGAEVGTVAEGTPVMVAAWLVPDCSGLEPDGEGRPVGALGDVITVGLDPVIVTPGADEGETLAGKAELGRDCPKVLLFPEDGVPAAELAGEVIGTGTIAPVFEDS